MRKEIVAKILGKRQAAKIGCIGYVEDSYLHEVKFGLTSVPSRPTRPSLDIQVTRHLTFFFTRSHQLFHYSVRRLLIGFAIAALIDWKLTVNNVINSAPAPATGNIHQDSSARYW